MFKKIFVCLFLISFIALGFFSFENLRMERIFVSVHAEDEEDEEDEKDEEDDDDRSSSSSSAAQTQTYTTSSTRVITLKDSDGDGILDKDDPHPNIPEIYIVDDVNLNGIVDKFEK